MKVNLIYYVQTSDGQNHKFETIEGATCFYDGCVKQLKHSKEHCNTMITDRWPILERKTTAYNGQFSDCEFLKLTTSCHKNPKGKSRSL